MPYPVDPERPADPGGADDPTGPASPSGMGPTGMGPTGMGPTGMGPTPSGPSFTQPYRNTQGGWQARWSTPLGPQPIDPPDPAAYTAPRSRLPLVATAVAVGVIALVVAVASVLAHRADQQADVRPTRTVSATPHVTATKDSIEFTTRSGSGRLTIVDHSWQDARSNPGAALGVEVRILCIGGVVEYDPFDFQAFDAAGTLFDLAAEEVRGQILGVGVLHPGEEASGQVAFVMPRGEVTLLMSDDANSVTALKIPD